MRPSPTSHDAHTNPATEPDLGLERIVFFSDAVIAIAITLLVIELKVPEIASGRAVEELPGRLLELVPQMRSFAISFVVIGVYWLGHHRMFRAIVRYDRGLMWLNLMFLFFIAFLPFPTSVLGQYGDTQIAVVFYAVSVALLGASKTLLWYYSSKNHRLIDPSLSPQAIQAELWRGLDAPLVFLFSIAISFISPLVTTISWLLMFPVGRILRRLMPAEGRLD